MFTALTAAGVDKSELVLAWDFVTASDEFLQQDLTTMRDAAIPAMGANGASLSFSATAQPPITGISASYLGTFKSPGFLSDGENDDSIIVRDDAGLPKLQGLRDAQFAALIPDCQQFPRPTVIFGHGLFGSAKEYLDDSFVQSLAKQYCFNIIAGDFIGLTSRQLQLAPLAVNDMNRGPQITEKLAQSVIDFIALETIARGPMATSPEFKVNGMAVIDPAKVYYVGGSLGGIMGNTFMAYDPNITRGVLAVPGGDWSLLFERSNAWHLLMGAAQGSYNDPEVYQLNIAFLGMGMEPYDPITTAAHVLHDPLPGVPAKTILIWYTMGDCLVTNISTELIARTMGIDMLAPNVKDVWHLTPKAGPLVSGINVYNDHPTPLPPDTNVPPVQDNGTHSGINRKPSALREVEKFLLEDTVVQTCQIGSGAPVACDCATGACD
jgi:pimeloyl-ACP methyl ester carboxylesterase